MSEFQDSWEDDDEEEKKDSEKPPEPVKSAASKKPQKNLAQKIQMAEEKEVKFATAFYSFPVCLEIFIFSMPSEYLDLFENQTFCMEHGSKEIMFVPFSALGKGACTRAADSHSSRTSGRKNSSTKTTRRVGARACQSHLW